MGWDDNARSAGPNRFGCASPGSLLAWPLMRLRPLIIAALLGCVASAPGGCKKTTSGGSADLARAKLPDPLPLPAEPVAAAYVADPAAALAMVDPWVDESLAPSKVLERGLRQFTTPELAAQLAPTVDPTRPWASVRFPEQDEVAYFPVKADAKPGLEQTLGGLSREGRFGAVRLPQPPEAQPSEGLAEASPNPWSTDKPHLAWLDPDTGHLAIATSLPALVTGRDLAKTYGSSEVFVTVDGRMLPPIVPLTRVTARGALADLEVTAALNPDRDPFEDLQITNGALTGLLSAPQMVAGATTRFAGHEDVVQRVIRNVDQAIDEQPFLVQGILRDLQKRFNAVLRTWNGRVMVALGPPGHVRVALGADDPKKAGVATTRFLDTIVDNVSLFRNFTSQVPSVSLKKKQGQGGGEPIHKLSIGNAKSLLQKEAHALVDDKNKLRVAMAFSRHDGAAMGVVGPDAVDVLAKWLDATAKAPSGEDSAGDLGAVMVALDPQEAPALRQKQIALDVLFGLTANGPRRSVVAQKLGEHEIRARVTTSGASVALPVKTLKTAN